MQKLSPIHQPCQYQLYRHCHLVISTTNTIFSKYILCDLFTIIAIFSTLLWYCQSVFLVFLNSPINLMASLSLTPLFVIDDQDFNDEDEDELFWLSEIIIIIITRPWPAFGRQGLVGSSGGYTYHGYTSHASPRACGARLGRKVSRNGRNVIYPIYRQFWKVSSGIVGRVHLSRVHFLRLASRLRRSARLKSV